MHTTRDDWRLFCFVLFCFVVVDVIHILHGHLMQKHVSAFYGIYAMWKLRVVTLTSLVDTLVDLMTPRADTSDFFQRW